MAHNGHGHGPVDDPNFVNDKPYETRDFFVFNSVLKWIFMLFVFVGISSAITLVIYNIMVPRSAERSSAFPLPQVRALPADPRLQANPTLDIRILREQENTALTTYGRDPQGNIHIPVDRAIDIVSQEGLPTRANPGQPNPDEPNSPTVTEGSAPTETAPAQPANTNGGATDTGTPATGEQQPGNSPGAQPMQNPTGSNPQSTGRLDANSTSGIRTAQPGNGASGDTRSANP
jgi:hypothetical protein